jgi:predicted phosphodiesterase
MKLRVISDIHLEINGGSLLLVDDLINNSDDADVLILAGDICALTREDRWIEFIEQMSKAYPYVLWVFGNHEYYSLDWSKAIDYKKYIEDTWSNVYVLDNEGTSILGQRFLGTTLWYKDNVNCYILQDKLGDFKAIGKPVSFFIEEGNKAYEFLASQGQKGDVWINHHLSTPLSIDPEFKNSRLNCYYLNDISNLIGNIEPSLVCHGHTHHSCDYKIYESRVICNPLGYYNSSNRDFNPHIILEV